MHADIKDAGLGTKNLTQNPIRLLETPEPSKQCVKKSTQTSNTDTVVEQSSVKRFGHIHAIIEGVCQLPYCDECVSVHISSIQTQQCKFPIKILHESRSQYKIN